MSTTIARAGEYEVTNLAQILGKEPGQLPPSPQRARPGVPAPSLR